MRIVMSLGSPVICKFIFGSQSFLNEESRVEDKD